MEKKRVSVMQAEEKKLGPAPAITVDQPALAVIRRAFSEPLLNDRPFADLPKAGEEQGKIPIVLSHRAEEHRAEAFRKTFTLDKDDPTGSREDPERIPSEVSLSQPPSPSKVSRTLASAGLDGGSGTASTTSGVTPSAGSTAAPTRVLPLNLQGSQASQGDSASASIPSVSRGSSLGSVSTAAGSTAEGSVADAAEPSADDAPENTAAAAPGPAAASAPVALAAAPPSPSRPSADASGSSESVAVGGSTAAPSTSTELSNSVGEAVAEAR